jgi:hypothetical protein
VHRDDVDLEQVLADFRAFVAGLAAGFDEETRLRDPHWGRQSEVVGQLSLTHVGRAEALGETYDRLAAHVAATGRPLAPMTRENAMPLPYHPLVFDAETADTVRRLYASDFDDFGYEPPQSLTGAEYDAALARWSEHALANFEEMNALIDRHQRIYTLVTEFRGQQSRTRDELKALRARAASSQQHVRAADAGAATLRRELERLRARQRCMTTSVSWRLTAPLGRAREVQLRLAAKRRMRRQTL